jgi:hypothetical protein
VAGEQGPFDLGQDGVVEADDVGEARLAGGEAGEQVGTHLLLDRARVALPSPAQRGQGSRIGRGHAVAHAGSLLQRH